MKRDPDDDDSLNEDPLESDQDPSDTLDVIECPNCRQSIVEDADICPRCGSALLHDEGSQQRKPTWWILLVIMLMLLLIGSRSCGSWWPNPE